MHSPQPNHQPTQNEAFNPAESLDANPVSNPQLSQTLSPDQMQYLMQLAT
jgi:hypothetical protein